LPKEVVEEIKGTKEWDYKKYFNLIDHIREVKKDDIEIEMVKSHRIETDSPWIMLAFSGDWHLGSFYVDPGKIDLIVDFIVENKHTYLITVGDLIDNFRRFRSTEALFEQLSPNDQYNILESLIERLTESEKLIATTWGNHDVEFDERLSGYSFVSKLIGQKTKYFNGMGKLKLQINEVKYKIGLTHHYKGTSIYNPNHEHIRFLKEQFPDCDIVAMGHRHFPASNWFPIFKSGESPIPYMVRCGSPKDCPYTARYYGRGISGNHYFFLNSEKKKIMWFNDVTTDFEDIENLHKVLVKS
jgi:predicted phosphodiesterase